MVKNEIDPGIGWLDRPVIRHEKAVIVTGKAGSSTVLFCEEDSYIEECISEHGIDAEDIGIGYDTPGISVWEGTFSPYKNFEDRYYEYEAKGVHRHLTREELEDINRGLNPFDARLKERARVVGIAVSCAFYRPEDGSMPGERVYTVRVEQEGTVRAHRFTITADLVTHDIPPEVDHQYGWWIRPITEAVVAYDRLTFTKR